MIEVKNVAQNLIKKSQAQKAVNAKSSNVRLTSRDLDMMEFINDMKFASAKEIHERFFTRKSDNQERPIFAAKNRLYSLSSGGYLTTEKIAEPDITVFVVTAKGVRALTNFKPMRTHPKPLGKIDHNVFLHDYSVLRMRLFLEKHHMISSWISERLMEAEMKITGGLPTDYHPDAIFVSPTGKRVAFEFERTSKSRDKYQKKISKFQDIMESGENASFNKVQYVCTIGHVQKALQVLSEMYRENFKVEMIDDFIKSIEASSSPTPLKENAPATMEEASA